MTRTELLAKLEAEEAEGWPPYDPLAIDRATLTRILHLVTYVVCEAHQRRDAA